MCPPPMPPIAAHVHATAEAAHRHAAAEAAPPHAAAEAAHGRGAARCRHIPPSACPDVRRSCRSSSPDGPPSACRRRSPDVRRSCRSSSPRWAAPRPFIIPAVGGAEAVHPGTAHRGAAARPPMPPAFPAALPAPPRYIAVPPPAPWPDRRRRRRLPHAKRHRRPTSCAYSRRCRTSASRASPTRPRTPGGPGRQPEPDRPPVGPRRMAVVRERIGIGVRRGRRPDPMRRADRTVNARAPGRARWSA